MLIIMRRQEEDLIINDNIKIKVLSITGNQVQLGIDAPRSIPVYRGEIYEEMKAEKAAKELEALSKESDTENEKFKRPEDKDGNC